MSRFNHSGHDGFAPKRLLLSPNDVSDSQKRRTLRTSTRGYVSVHSGSEPAPLACRLWNVSPTGLQLSLPTDIAPGSILRVDLLPEQSVSAVVRWSRTGACDRLVGAELSEPIDWSDVWRIRANAKHSAS